MSENRHRRARSLTTKDSTGYEIGSAAPLFHGLRIDHKSREFKAIDTAASGIQEGVMAQRSALVNSLHLGSNSVSAPLLQRRRAAAILMAIAIAVPSRLAASGVTPTVNRYLLLQDVELGAEAAEELPKQVPL
jgi:hypothetical protein